MFLRITTVTLLVVCFCLRDIDGTSWGSRLGQEYDTTFPFKRVHCVCAPFTLERPFVATEKQISIVHSQFLIQTSHGPAVTWQDLGTILVHSHLFTRVHVVCSLICSSGLYQRLHISPTPEIGGQQTESIPSLDQLPVVSQNVRYTSVK